MIKVSLKIKGFKNKLKKTAFQSFKLWCNQFKISYEEIFFNFIQFTPLRTFCTG